MLDAGELNTKNLQEDLKLSVCIFTVIVIDELEILRYDFLQVREVTSLLTYLLTPWSRVLLEKLASLQLVKKFPAFCGTRRFLTALTSARHLSLS